MAKSILTPEGDLVNYDNLIAVSVEVRPVGVDEEHSEDEYCIVGTDVTNKENLLYHSPDYASVTLPVGSRVKHFQLLRCRPQTKAVMRNAVRL